MSRSFRVVDDFVRFTIDPNHPLPYLDIQYCRAMRFFARKVVSSRKTELNEMYKVLASDSDKFLALNRVCADVILMINITLVDTNLFTPLITEVIPLIP